MVLYGIGVPTAVEIPLAPWPRPLTVAQRVGGPVALVEGPVEGIDAWVTASALAQAGPAVPLLVIVDVPRRPVGILALMAATLDQLAGGRLLLGLRDASDVEARALDRLLRGEVVFDAGLRGAVLGVKPVQQPRPPLLRYDGKIWVEGEHRWSIRPANGTELD